LPFGSAAKLGSLAERAKEIHRIDGQSQDILFQLLLAALSVPIDQEITSFCL
jgi:hypothetical protein